MMTQNATIDHNQDDTRQRIIRAAMQVFGEVGYSQATTRSLAEAAGVNEVTLFRHFGSKKNLLMACIEAHNASGFSASFATELSGNYAQDILRMARLQIQDSQANQQILHLLLCEARHFPELREAMLAGGRENLALLSGYFQRQIEAGIVRSDIPADVLASAFDSLFSSPVLFASLFQDPLSPQLSIEETLAPLAKLFVSGTQTIVERND